MGDESARSVYVDDELRAEFPELRVVELEVDGVRVKKSHSGLDRLKSKVYEEVRSSGKSLETLKDEPVLRAYREFYWKVGIDPTKTRPAAEALLRRILAGKEIPAINTLVDAYNLVSLETSVAIAAFDCASVHPESLKLRRAQAAEPFLGIGMTQAIMLEGTEVVIEDMTARELVAVYPFRNAERGKVTEATRRAFLIMCGVPGIEDSPLETARNLCQRYLSEYCSETS